jgi:hypothetical protein
VTPAAPGEVFDADLADPGEMAKIKAEQIKNKKGKYGSTKVPGGGSSGGDDEDDSGWVDIVLLDQHDQPVTGQRYEITLTDGRVVRGTTDSKGGGRAAGFAPGSCKVAFPDVDKDAWQKA